MPEIGTSGSMSGDGKRSDAGMAQATAPILDSTICDLWRHLIEGCLRRLSGRVATAARGPGLTQCGLSQRLLSGSVIPRGPVRTNRISTRYYVWKWHLGPPARVRAISTGRFRPRGEGRKGTQLPP